MEALDALNEEEREEISPKYEVRVYKKFGDFFEKFIISWESIFIWYNWDVLH